MASNRLLGVTSDGARLAPGRSGTAAALRSTIELHFFQVLPRLDVTMPIGIGYNLFGLSETDPTMNRGSGDVSAGLTATLDRGWTGAITATHYFGRSKDLLAAQSQQPLSNFDFIRVSLKRAF